MKQVYIFDGKRKEVEQRNLMHFEVQKNTRGQIQKSKKIYSRKKKHKNNLE